MSATSTANYSVTLHDLCDDDLQVTVAVRAGTPTEAIHLALRQQGDPRDWVASSVAPTAGHGTGWALDHDYTAVSTPPR